MDLSDRMKMYEGIESDRMLIPNLPVMVRLDGKSFHTWTRGMERPYDQRIQDLMDSVTVSLVDQTNAVIGYTQSDEITLAIWNGAEPESQIMFNGRTQKLVSVLASMATAYFNVAVPQYFKGKPLAFFDCRVWNVPSAEEAVNCLVWRELDATRNSIQMAAQSLYSPKQLHQKSCPELQEMCWQRGVNWNDYPARFKRGGYFKRKLIERYFTSEELARLPEHHEARKYPDLMIQRHIIEKLDLPPMLKIANRVAVVFDDAEVIPAE